MDRLEDVCAEKEWRMKKWSTKSDSRLRTVASRNKDVVSLGPIWEWGIATGIHDIWWIMSWRFAGWLNVRYGIVVVVVGFI